MGRVLIIKNNNSDKRIHDYAKKSYEENKKCYYNTVDGTLNEQALVDLNKRFEGEGIVLMITYEKSAPKKIEDVFIGRDVKINDKNSIEYIMKVHLSSKCHKRTIDSIIDKIDLDLDADFGYGHYVIMSDMESLFQELQKRINASEEAVLESKNKTKERSEKAYELNVLAQKEEQSIRIYPSDDVGECRTEFQRDRERVVNCKAFRRMVDKAQIFGSEKGDYYRTRMTHSLEVNQIAKAIAYALHLNLDLTEAIALGHDLGHTPFGHQGERTLDEILAGKINVGISAGDGMFQKRCFGGFKHNYQSAKILTKIEEKYEEFPGLNVSVQVVEGVLKHTRLKPKEIDIYDFLSEMYVEKLHISDSEEQVCSSLEGQVVAIADEIAQRGHDVDDALTSGVMSIEEFKDRLKIDKCKNLFERINEELEQIEKSKRLIVDRRELKIARIVSVIVNFFIEETIEYSSKQVEKYEKSGKNSVDNKKSMIDFSTEVKRINWIYVNTLDTKS